MDSSMYQYEYERSQEQLKKCTEDNDRLECLLAKANNKNYELEKILTEAWNLLDQWRLKLCSHK